MKINIDHPLLSGWQIKTKYDDVKIVAVTGAVSFAIADPKV